MKINVRYIINDLEETVAFYTEKLGFKIDLKVNPGFAALSKDNLNLFLNKPGYGGAGQPMPDGAVPRPGGWNRFQFEVNNLAEFVEGLKKSNVKFRNEIVTGQGGKQVLIEDPSGNLIELFQPADKS